MGVREVSVAYVELPAVAADAVPSGYKQTEVAVIPEDWRVVPIAQLADRVTVGFVGSMAHLFTQRGIPLLRGQNITPGKLDLTDSLFISETTHRLWKKSALKAGDLVLVRVGYPGTSCVIPASLGEANAASLVVVRPNTKMADARFLSLFINSDIGKRQIESLLVGGAQQVLNTTTATFLKVPLPKIVEQEAIAEALSDADALIESLQQLIAKKRQIKQGAMQALLSGQQRLPGFSNAWPVMPLGDLFEFSGGFTASRDQLGSEGYCYLHYGDIHTSSKSFVDVRAEYQNIPKLDVPLKRVASTSLLNEGDVVFVDASEDDEGASKHVVILNTDGQPFISGLHTIVAKAKTQELAHDYLCHCFHTKAIKNQFRFFAVGTKVSGISKTNIAKITMPVPAITEQISIAAILSDMNAEVAALEIRLGKARQIKQGMMQALLTGAIRLPLAKAA